ncbi:MAG TPA: DUF3426 domain-containing protein [Anaerolineae bacterium]|nr:DUF3426 domain-containing protein [Anaerolineae bacterium]
MIITCEKCNTKFNLDENLLKQSGSKVRCSKCRNIFLAYPPTEMERVAGPAEEMVGSETEEEAEPAFETEEEELYMFDIEETPETETKVKEEPEEIEFELDAEPLVKEELKEPEQELELADVDKEEIKKEVAETVDLELQADQMEKEEVEKPKEADKEVAETVNLEPQADQMEKEEVEKPKEADVETEEASITTEQETTPAEKKRISTPVLVALIIALLTAGAYGTYMALNSMNIKIPFISDLVEPAVQDEVGDLKIIAFDIADKSIDNPESGELFIISGKVKNGYSGARSFIRVTGKLYDEERALSKTATVCCGNVLSDEDLSTMDMNSINKRLLNLSGDNKSNVNIKPGEVLQFMIVFANIEDNIKEYTVEVAGSSPAQNKG